MSRIFGYFAGQGFQLAKLHATINKVIFVPCRWLTYMTQVVDLSELGHVNGLLTWILPSGCHKMMTQF